MGACALVAACDFNEDHFMRSFKQRLFEKVFALDAGFAHLENLGLKPDEVIGDFDSLGYVPAGENVSVHPVKKDKSDLELGFDAAHAQGFKAAYVYGAIGGRLDHSVANLQMCARFAESGMDVQLIGISDVVKVLVGPATYVLPARGTGTVSVFSACDESKGVTERGMEYALEGATLTNRTTLGLSNELVGTQASVAVDEGTLFVFHPAV